MTGPIGAQEGSLSIVDGSLHYEISGNGPVLVFAHGLGGNHRSWWQQVPHLSADYTCLTFSHRGFVPSHDDTGQPRPHLFAEDLTALLDHLGYERVAIVAQSMGGWTAMEFALNTPDRVTALVLSATTGTLRHPGLVTLAATATDSRNGVLRARGFHPAAGERMAREQPALHRLFGDISLSSGEWDRDALRRALDNMRVRDPHELRSVTCPVLALVGAEDVVCPPANVGILASGLPHAHLTVVPCAGHSVYFERPAMFNDAVLNFLRDTEVAR
jgi:pimeloyl-ACP methyl ester carboxylesterase